MRIWHLQAVHKEKFDLCPRVNYNLKNAKERKLTHVLSSADVTSIITISKSSPKHRIATVQGLQLLLLFPHEVCFDFASLVHWIAAEALILRNNLEVFTNQT